MTRFYLRVLTLVCLAVAAFGQGTNSDNLFGAKVASNYNNWKLYLNSSVTSGSQTLQFQPSACLSISVGSRNIVVLNTNAPIKINDSNAETITPSAVTVNASTCSATVSLSNAHGAGAQVISGTGGLQEAMNDLPATGGTVLVTPDFQGTTANITASAGGSQILIEDLRGAVPVYYGWRPTAVSLIAAPSAPTVTVATGSLTSGAYRVMVAYVDALGGVSLASTDSTQTATTTGLSITSPAATTGAVGYLPYITAAAGGTGTEILAKATIDSTICTLTTLETVVPACAIGATATVTAANPTSTAKPVVESTSFVTYGYLPFASLPQPFMNAYPFGVFVATATLNNSNADAAQLQTPAGYFNKLGGAWDVCVKGGTGTQVASSIITVNLTMAAQYAQSPVTVSSVAFPTQTQGAAGTFEGCVRIHTSTTGSSGKFWSSSPSGPWHNFLNSAPGTQVVSADASAAQSSAIDLTKQLWVAANLAGTGTANITVPIINSISITPVPGS